MKRTKIMRIPEDLAIEIELVSKETGWDKFQSGKVIANMIKDNKKKLKENNKNVWDYFKL